MTISPSEHPRAKGGTARGRQISARRVRDLITASIRAGLIDADDPLAEEDLMVVFDTSRGSVRAALTQLSEIGFVERKRRVGTTVSRIGVSMPLTDIQATHEAVFIEIVEDRVVPSFPLVRERLQLDEPEVRMVENTFTSDDEVIGLRSAYYSRRYSQDPRVVPITSPMSETLRVFFGADPGQVTVSMGSDAADAHTARVLGVAEGHPLIVREMTYHSADGLPLQTVFDRFRGDRVRLEAVTSVV